MAATMNGSFFIFGGHSFEFDKNDSDRWAEMDTICRKLAGREGIWYATNRKICNYVTAARSADLDAGVNNTGIDLFIEKDGENLILKK